MAKATAKSSKEVKTPEAGAAAGGETETGTTEGKVETPRAAAAGYVRGEVQRELENIRAHAVNGGTDVAIAAIEEQLSAIAMARALMVESEKLYRDELQKLAPGRVPAIAGAALPETVAEGKTRVNVTGPKQGRYRNGRHFSAEAVTVDVSAGELAALEADSALSVKRG